MATKRVRKHRAKITEKTKVYCHSTAHFSDGRYRIFHRKIQKKYRNFDSQSIYFADINSYVIETGINKSYVLMDDDTYFDVFKD